MWRITAFFLSALTVVLTAPSAARSQSGGGAAFGGHAVVSDPLRLMGIEPLPSVAREEVPSSAGRLPGVQQAQYPLDNRIWETPPSESWPPGALPPAPPGRPPLTTPLPAPSAVEPWIRLQEAYGEATWIAHSGGSDGLGWWSLDLRTKFEFPRAPMLAITPRVGWHFLDGPQVTDLPAQLYDASLETVVSLPLIENWFVQGAVSPSFFTDGDNTSSDALRLPARLLFFWRCTEHLTLSAGLAYLDREDLKFLPNAGLIYRPHDDFKLELMIPRPRVAWRISTDGTTDRWAYIVGELGGGSWGVRRAAGFNDVATYGDYRAMLGWEQLEQTGLDLRCEVGLVFSRSLEYVSGLGNRDLPATGLVRIALTY